jgi:transposase
MFKQRDAQRSLFEAQCWPTRVPSDSFYARLSQVSDMLFPDGDLAGMYSPDQGRPCLPPGLLCGILLLQFFDNVSDSEAVQRVAFDLRWKVALRLPLDFAPPHPSSLSVFRSRLLVHGKERYAFNRLVALGRKAGLLQDKVTLLMDTTPQHGAGAVQDTYTLIRKATRELLRRAGYNTPGKRQGLGAKLAVYLDSNEKAEIDWSDAQARGEQLKVLVQDAEAALELVEHSDDPEVRAAAWLLTKILGDDIEVDEEREPRIAQGVAKDRIVSVTDPELRHGRKSSSQRFEGRKLQVAMDAGSGFLLAVEPMAANQGDGQTLLETVERVEEQHPVKVERVIADGAYGSGENRAACQERGIDLVSPQAKPQDAQVHKSAFTIEGRDCICPQGQHASKCMCKRDAQGRAALAFAFDREVCAACPLFSRCVHSGSHGRCVSTHYHETLLRAERKRQETEDFKALYRGRAAVERVIAHLIRHGLRRARYLGRLKDVLQSQWTGAVVNLTILFRLLDGVSGPLRQALAAAS